MATDSMLWRTLIATLCPSTCYQMPPAMCIACHGVSWCELSLVTALPMNCPGTLLLHLYSTTHWHPAHTPMTMPHLWHHIVHWSKFHNFPTCCIAKGILPVALSRSSIHIDQGSHSKGTDIPSEVTGSPAR